MIKPLRWFSVMVLAAALLFIIGCGPMEEAKESREEPVTEATSQQPIKNPNELDHWNGVDIFFKNGWVDT